MERSHSSSRCYWISECIWLSFSSPSAVLCKAESLISNIQGCLSSWALGKHLGAVDRFQCGQCTRHVGWSHGVYVLVALALAGMAHLFNLFKLEGLGFFMVHGVPTWNDWITEDSIHSYPGTPCKVILYIWSLFPLLSNGQYTVKAQALPTPRREGGRVCSLQTSLQRSPQRSLLPLDAAPLPFSSHATILSPRSTFLLFFPSSFSSSHLVKNSFGEVSLLKMQMDYK